MLTVRPGSGRAKRGVVMREWHKSLLHGALPGLIRKWESKLDVEVAGYFLQRMKTKWGSCNHRAGHIRLETELGEEAQGPSCSSTLWFFTSLFTDRAHPQ